MDDEETDGTRTDIRHIVREEVRAVVVDVLVTGIALFWIVLGIFGLASTVGQTSGLIPLGGSLAMVVFGGGLLTLIWPWDRWLARHLFASRS